MSYLGQGALILRDPTNVGAPFFRLVPDWGRLPLVVLATVATVIASRAETAPLAMRANVEHHHVRHEHVLILSILTEPVPRIPADQHVVVDDLGYADDGIVHLTARFGYMEAPNVPEVLRRVGPAAAEGRMRLDEASYFLSKVELRPGHPPTMALWLKRLFIATSYLTADAAEHFGLPRNRTVIMGSHIEV
ncbi:KUP/HAK/KT family potassium transporter [Micromonospora echinospora]